MAEIDEQEVPYFQLLIKTLVSKTANLQHPRETVEIYWLAPYLYL